MKKEKVDIKEKEEKEEKEKTKVKEDEEREAEENKERADVVWRQRRESADREPSLFPQQSHWFFFSSFLFPSLPFSSLLFSSLLFFAFPFLSFLALLYFFILFFVSVFLLPSFPIFLLSRLPSFFPLPSSSLSVCQLVSLSVLCLLYACLPVSLSVSNDKRSAGNNAKGDGSTLSQHIQSFQSNFLFSRGIFSFLSLFLSFFPLISPFFLFLNIFSFSFFVLFSFVFFLFF